jgi:hypothetical protein
MNSDCERGDKFRMEAGNKWNQMEILTRDSPREAKNDAQKSDGPTGSQAHNLEAKFVWKMQKNAVSSIQTTNVSESQDSCCLKCDRC